MRPSRLVPVLALALATAGLSAPYAAAVPRGSAPRVAQHRKYRPTGRLEVRFKDGAGAEAQRAALARVTGRGHRVHVDVRVPGLNAAVLSVSNARAVQALLRDDSAVAYVEAESRYVPFADEPVSNELHEVGADTVHAAGNSGAGAEIAVIDSRVDAANPDLDGAGKVVFAGEYSTDVPNDPNDPFQTTDAACTPAKCPHGTAVADVATGENDGTGMEGVAPGATIRSYNVFRRFVYTDPQDGSKSEDVGASSGDIANALDAVATYAATHPALVAVNMSLGGPFESRLVRDAIAALHGDAPRVTVVVAAGNDASERATFPAGDPYVLSVGALTQAAAPNDCSSAAAQSDPWTIAPFSTRGDVDVMAPGRCVTAWYPSYDDTTGAVLPGTVALRGVDGTSFAAPMVAGVAALLSTATAPVAGDAARAAIIAGATHPGSPDPGLGNGNANAPAALDVADGPGTYTAIAADRGGMVATNVGRRRLELLRVDPASASAPAAATLVVPTGDGGSGAPTTTTRGNVATTGVTYVAPSAGVPGTAFHLTADDGAALPVRLLDAADSFEGLPATSGETNHVALTYGTRTAYIRSAAVPNAARMDYSFSYDAHATDADVFLWEPATTFGTADAASEPIWSGGFDTDSSNHVTVGTRSDPCEYLGGPPDAVDSYRACRSGRYLFGWLTFGHDDDSAFGSTYGLTAKFGPAVSSTVPLLTSSVATSPAPFAVSWKGTNGAAKYDVQYGVRTKNPDGSWTQNYHPWLTQTTATSATFGSGSVPVTVTLGQTYSFLVTAYDNYGNRSPASSKPAIVPYDDFTKATYTPSWKGTGATSRWQGSVHSSSVAGATATFTADGGQLFLVGDKCPTCGQLKVYVGGVYAGTVDTYASTTKYRQTLYTGAITAVANGRTLKVVVVGTSGRPKVAIDGWAARR
jgi:hypothetical protein